MIHICFICPYIGFTSASGDAVISRELIRSLSNRVELSVVTSSGTPSILSRYLSRIKNLKSYIIVPSKMAPLAYYKGLKKLYEREQKIDVIHILGLNVLSLPFVFKLATDKGTRIIFHNVMSPSMAETKVEAFLFSKFVADVIATSPYIAGRLKRYIKNKIHMIPPPVDHKLYRPQNNSKLPWIEDGKKILYIGPLDSSRFPAKQVLKVMKSIRGCEMNLIVAVAPRYKNDDVRIKKLKSLISKEDMSRNVTIIPRRLSLQEKICYYSQADVVLFPFTSRVGGVVDPPLTLLEAMSCSGLVVGTRTLSIPWVIRDDHNGFLCKSAETAELKNVLRRALQMDKGKLDSIRKNARTLVIERFSPEKTCRRIVLLYEDVLKLGTNKAAGENNQSRFRLTRWG